MSMIKVKTAELIGPALDWAVDWVVSGKPLDVLQKKDGSGEWAYFHEGNWFASGPRKCSTDWSQCGPLRDKYRVELEQMMSGSVGAKCTSDGESPIVLGLPRMPGSDALTAICRAIVAAKLGDTVEVPKELMP